LVLAPLRGAIAGSAGSGMRADVCGTPLGGTWEDMRWPTKLFLAGLTIFLLGVVITVAVARTPGFLIMTLGGVLAGVFVIDSPWLRGEARWRARR
jgi:hypothetical protein